jgi:hypothetical protein
MSSMKSQAFPPIDAGARAQSGEVMKIKTNIRAGAGANAGGVNAGGVAAGGGGAGGGGGIGSVNSSHVAPVPAVYTPGAVASIVGIGIPRCSGV